MTAPILTVTEQGQRRYVAGDPTPAQPTALARIDPDQVVRQALDQQSATVNAYLRTVAGTAARTVDAGAQRSPNGYSNAHELQARNARYFVTVGAYVLVSAILAAGLVWLATLARLTPGDWFWPAWFTLSGAMALGLIWLTHQGDARLTPEGIEAIRADADAYSQERQADGQFLISQAISQAIAWKAEAEYSDSAARQLATEAAYGQMTSTPAASPARRFAVQWQEDDPAMLTYATSIDVGAHTAPSHGGAAPRIVCTPAQPDAALLAMLATVDELFDQVGAGDNLITSRLPWSQRGDWNASMKRTAIDVLARIDPPLLLAGDGGRWRLNTAAWCKPIALSALRRRWPRD